MKYLPSDYVQNVTVYLTIVEIMYMNHTGYMVDKSELESLVEEKITESNKYELAEKYNEIIYLSTNR